MQGSVPNSFTTCFLLYAAAVDVMLLCRFTATAMPGGMYDFAAVSPPGSSIVLTFGGVDSATGRHRDGIDLYDRYSSVITLASR